MNHLRIVLIFAAPDDLQFRVRQHPGAFCKGIICLADPDPVHRRTSGGILFIRKSIPVPVSSIEKGPIRRVTSAERKGAAGHDVRIQKRQRTVVQFLIQADIKKRNPEFLYRYGAVLIADRIEQVVLKIDLHRMEELHLLFAEISDVNVPDVEIRSRGVDRASPCIRATLL